MSASGQPAVAARGLASGRLAAAIGALIVVAAGLALGEAGFTVVVAALAGGAAADLAVRLDSSSPAEVDREDGELASVSRVVVAIGAVATSIGAGWRIRGTLSVYLGLGVAVIVIGVWGMLRAGRAGLSGALARSALTVFICGFGAAHAVLLRRDPEGLKLAIFLVVCVALYETAATIFEMATVQVRPGRNRQAPLAGGVLCFVAGLVAGSVANPPITYGAGMLVGISVAAAAAAGRAMPALFALGRTEGGIEIAAVVSALFVAAPVAYYVARVAI